MNKKLLSILVTITISLCGCGNTQNVNSTSKTDDIVNEKNKKEVIVSSQIKKTKPNTTTSSSITSYSDKDLETKISDNNVQKNQTETKNKVVKEKDQENVQVPEKNNKKEAVVTDKEPTPEKENNISNNMDSFDNTERQWFFMPNKEGLTPDEPEEVLNLIKNRDAYYVGDTDSKCIYLTFDEGYENGFTPKILDTLKENNIKAAFFVTKPYVENNKELVKRMVKEGHLVCNHSVTHQSMDKLALEDKEKFESEFLDTEEAFEEATGTKMPKFFRPPMGAYNELSLHYTQDLGYKTIFWSSAYRDYDVNNQPELDYAKDLIMERTHNGSIILLHAVSETNTEILDYLIKEWSNRGFEFKQLSELP